MASQVYASVLAARLAAELRHKQGLSYSPSAVYLVRDGSFAHVLAGADGVPETLSILVSEFIGIIARLGDRPSDTGELLSAVERMMAMADKPGAAAAARVRRAASNVLCGRATGTLASWKEQLAAVSPEDVRQVAAEAFGSALFALPNGYQPHRAQITHLPWVSAVALGGRRVPSADAPFVTTRLVLGTEGVSVVHGEEALAVPYDDCAALRCWPDGARQLIGTDGIAVHVEPTLWRLPAGSVRQIDAAVPASRHVAMPYRPPDQIPHPGTTAGMRLAGRILKEPLAATAVTLVFVIGLPLAVAQISAAGGEILGGILALTVFTSLAVTREIRARFWVAAARRARGVEPPPDF